jgi:hypothetical protein
MAGYLDMFMDRGATFNSAITLTDTNGNALNLVNYVVASVMKKSYVTANVAATFTILIPNPSNGQVVLNLPAATTANLSPLRYVYDVVVRNTTTNLVDRILEGTVYVNASVTPTP